MPLTDLLAAVQTQLCTATDRDSVLQAAAGLLACRQANAEQIYLNLCQREALGSTAIGHGIAIPHGRAPTLDRPVAPCCDWRPRSISAATSRWTWCSRWPSPPTTPTST
jgi:hypothetical protein